MPIDVTRSILRWRGTKLGGRREHSGVVRLSEGHLLQCGEAVCGGTFVVDMTTIQVTDIPVSQPEPRQQLTDHLKSRDFFWSERHPTAELTLTGLRRAAPGRYRVTGDLRIQDVTRAITFDAEGRSERGEGGLPREIEAKFRIDRQDWGISYRFDPIRNAIVDDDVDFHLSMYLADSPAS